MKKLIAVLLVMATATIASAQEYRVEHSLGYSYVNIGTNNLASRQNANGWQATDSINVSKWFAIEDMFSAYYKTYQVPFSAISSLSPCCSQPSVVPFHVSDYSLAVGPRINMRPLFFHALVGGDYLTNSEFFIPPTTHSQGGLIGLFGGGVELPFSAHFALRTVADYSFTNHNRAFGASAYTQNNFGVGAALVFRWWKVSPRGSVVASQPTTHGMLIPTLGILATKPRLAEGAEIASITPDSLAAQTRLHVGDIIDSVDGKVIQSPMELAVELSGRPVGSKIKIGHSTSRYWHTETVLILEK